LEIKLRETPGPFDSAEPTPVSMGAAPTERLALPAPTEPPLARLQTLGPDRSEREVVIARSTLIGICLTAFACGIVTTVALDRHHFRAMERDLLRAHDEQTAFAPPEQPPAPAPAPAAEMAPPQPQAAAPAPVAPAPAPAAAPAPAPAAPVAEPVVVQMAAPAAVDTPPAKAVAEPPKPVADSAKPATARVAVARTPRPPAAARPVVHHKAAAEAATESAPASQTGEWKDPFAE
jgi:hypothetical protein